MKKKSKRRKVFAQTDEQIALTCTSAVQAYKISPNVHREYLKLYLDEAVKLGIVKEVSRDGNDG